MIVVILLLMIFLAILAFNVQITNKKISKTIYKKINLYLPDEFECIYYEHNLRTDSIYTKIQIERNDISYIIDQLSNSSVFLQNHNYNEKDVIPNFKNIYKWFDISNSDIVYIFRTIRTDKKYKDKGIHYIWLFICQEDNQYYLYLCF